MRVAVLVTMLGSTLASADGKPPAGASKITIDYTYRSFHSNELHYTLEWNKSAYRSDTKVVVDGKLIEALYASLTDLKPFDDDIACISHTDDYPKFTIAIEGDSPVVINSESNCHANVPWNVIENGKHSAQLTGAIPKAVYKLLAAVDSKHWSGRADAPDASTSFGTEIVAIGEFRRGSHPGNAAATACVHEVETSAKVKQVFGESPQVRELNLGCDLGQSKDCARLVAESEFGWDGVALQIELPCTKGIVDIAAPLAAQIAELRTFVDSKPMRTLVRLSGKEAPRVWNNGEWTSEGQFDDAPMVAFTPGKKTIHLRAIGERGPAAVKYLRELGIDAKKATKHAKGNMFFETDLDVDFNGKLVARP